MSTRFQRITPFLWFDTQAEDAANFYVSIFENARIVAVNRYSEAAATASGKPMGSAMTVAFELDGQRFTALNGGPLFNFNQAVSLVVHCKNQDEVDHYWNHLSQGGDPNAQQCAWLKDRYGLSWQVVPERLIELLSHPDPSRAQKAMHAMLAMKKIDIAALERAVA